MPTPLQRLRQLFKWGPRTSGPRDLGPNKKYISPMDVYRDVMKLPRDRNKLYDLYEELDEIPEISSVLDAYAEDSTQFDKERGASIWVEGKEVKIVQEITELFKRIEVEEHLEGIARDLAKYGDDFARCIKYSPERDPEKSKFGILAVEWVDPRTIERVEDEEGVLLGFMDSNKIGGNQIKEEELYKPWDFIHFRLRSRKYVTRSGGNVYGTSLLRNASRPGKQMRMLDDMLMIWRLTKSMDTRIFYVDTGNAGPEEIPEVLKEWQGIFSKQDWKSIISGETSALYDPMTWDTEIFWPVRPGSNTKVDVIRGTANLSDLADVDHKRNQLFGSLRAPKSHFGFDGEVDAQQSLASKDIRFARLAKKLQRGLITGFTRMAQIHLALKNMDTNTENFKIKLTEASLIEYIHKLESQQILIDIAERMLGMGDQVGLKPIEWRLHVLKMVFGFSEIDIKKYFEPQLVKKPGETPPDTMGGMGAQTAFSAMELDRAVKQAVMEKAVNRGVDREIFLEEGSRFPLPPRAEDDRVPAALPERIRVGNIMFKRDGESYVSEQPPEVSTGDSASE